MLMYSCGSTAKYAKKMLYLGENDSIDFFFLYHLKQTGMRGQSRALYIYIFLLSHAFPRFGSQKEEMRSTQQTTWHSDFPCQMKIPVNQYKDEISEKSNKPCIQDTVIKLLRYFLCILCSHQICSNFTLPVLL